MNEILEVVDEQNRVIGTEKRSVIHKKKLLRRAVALLILKGNDEILLAKRPSDKDINPDCWTFSVSGHMRPGERPDDAIKRETKEELGVHLNAECVRLFPPAKDCENYFIYVYITRLEEKSERPEFTARESKEIVFWGKEDILENKGSKDKFSPHFLKVFRWLVENGKI